MILHDFVCLIILFCIGAVPYSHLGCFRDSSKKRLLSNYVKKLPNNSPTHCVNLCLQSGYLYAGVEYGNECFCGKTLPPQEFKLSNDLCNMECPKNPIEKCGGYFSISIYNTGLPSEILLFSFKLFCFMIYNFIFLYFLF